MAISKTVKNHFVDRSIPLAVAGDHSGIAEGTHHHDYNSSQLPDGTRIFVFTCTEKQWSWTHIRDKDKPNGKYGNVISEETKKNGNDRFCNY